MCGGGDDDVLAEHELEHGSKLTGQRGGDGRKGKRRLASMELSEVSIRRREEAAEEEKEEEQRK